MTANLNVTDDAEEAWRKQSDPEVQCHQESGPQLRQVSASSGQPCLPAWMRIVTLLTGTMLVMQGMTVHTPLATLVSSRLKVMPDYSFHTGSCRMPSRTVAASFLSMCNTTANLDVRNDAEGSWITELRRQETCHRNVVEQSRASRQLTSQWNECHTSVNAGRPIL